MKRKESESDKKGPKLKVLAPERLSDRGEKLEDYRHLAPGEEPVEPYFMIFMRPAPGDLY